MTTRLTGDARPKQFCPLFDGQTLLEVTRRRVSTLIPDDQQVIVLTAGHRPYCEYLFDELPWSSLAVQPANRGTAPGILYGLLRIARLAGDIPVAVFPSDHWVDVAFMNHVAAATAVIEARADVVLLLGVEATSAECEYGWIEPGRRAGYTRALVPLSLGAWMAFTLALVAPNRGYLPRVLSAIRSAGAGT